jgi:hypothetical protein
LFCPNCGSENSQEQRFCRQCGLHLQTIAQVVSHQINASKAPLSKFAEPQTIWQNPLFYGFLLVLFGVIIATIGKRFTGEQGIADVGTIISMIGVAFFVIKGIFLIQRARFAQPTSELPKAETTTELPHLLEAKEQPSITEFTTRNFDPVYAERYDPERSNNRTHEDKS